MGDTIGNALDNHIDSISLKYPDGSLTVFAIAYDANRNKLGRILCNWSTSGTLHAISETTSVSQIYYDAAKATNDEKGYIYASAISDSSKLDSLFVQIHGANSSATERIGHPQSFFHVYYGRDLYTCPLPDKTSHGSLSCVLYSLSGRMIFENTAGNPSETVCINPNLQAGTYILNIRTANRRLMSRQFYVVR